MQKRRLLVRSLPALYGLLLLLNHELHAQLSYEFTTASEPYAHLTGSTPLSSDAGGRLSDTSFALDMEGEKFTFYGDDYTPNAKHPLTISGSGFIQFDSDFSSVVIDGFLVFLDRFDAESRISYTFDQSEEERILKVEWRKVAMIDSPEVAGDFLSFQVWVYQKSGVVELRYGPRTLFADSGVGIAGGPFVGIFQFSQDPYFRIFEKNWLIGNPFAPTYDTTRTGFSILEGCPREGTVFRFTPRAVSGVNDQSLRDGRDGSEEYSLYPNPTDGSLTLEAHRPLQEGARVRIVDLLGRVISETEIDRSTERLELSLPHPGTYYCEVTGEEGTRIINVVRQ